MTKRIEADELIREAFNKKSDIEDITFQYHDHDVILSGGVSLLVERQPEVMKEILNSLEKHFNVSENIPVEYALFDMDVSYTIMKVDDIFYIYFIAER